MSKKRIEITYNSLLNSFEFNNICTYPSYDGNWWLGVHITIIQQVTLISGLAQLFLVEILFRVITIYWFTQFQKMKQASMTFSVTFEFFNLENLNVNFLWKAVVLHKPPIFHTKSNKMPMIWPQIWALWHRKPLDRFLWKIHGFSQNLWFSRGSYQIPTIWPQIRVPWCRKPIVQPLWKIHGFYQNLWFSLGPYKIPTIWHQIRVPWCQKPFGQPLSKIHGFCENRCFIYLCGHTSKQASRQFFFPRLFSTRKRIYISAKEKDETFLC